MAYIVDANTNATRVTLTKVVFFEPNKSINFPIKNPEIISPKPNPMKASRQFASYYVDRSS